MVGATAAPSSWDFQKQTALLEFALHTIRRVTARSYLNVLTYGQFGRERI